MSLSEYAYINARIGGMKSRLLSKEKMRAMMEAKDINEVASMLKGTPYADYVDTSTALSVIGMEVGLKKSLHGDYVKIINSMKGPSRNFIRIYAKRFEINVIKSLIKMKTTKSELREYLIPFGEIMEERIERFLSRENLSLAIEELKGTSYHEILKPALEQKLEQRQEKAEEKKEGIEKTAEEIEREMLFALDAYYFGELEKSEKELSKRDKSFVERFIGLEIDLANLLTALRLKGLNAEHEKYFVEGGKRIDLKIFKKLCAIEETSKIEQAVPRAYAEFVKEALELYALTKSMTSFEVVFKKSMIKESRKVFLGERFHIGTILAYLNLKENEIANLIKITKMKDEFFTPREIENFLVAV